MRELLARAIMASSQGVLVTAPDGRVCLINQALTDMLGWSTAELAGERVERLVPDRHRRRHRSDRESYLGDPAAREIQRGRDLYACHADGSEIPVEVRVVPVPTSTGVFTVASLIDLRARRERTARTRAAVQLTSLGALASSVAHEVNNPNATVTANLEAVQSQLEELDTSLIDDRARALFEEAQSAIRESLAAAARVTAVVSQLKVLTHCEVTPSRTRLCLNDLVQWACLVFQGEMLERAQLQLELSESLPPLKGDAAGLNQVVASLLSNAREAIMPGAPHRHCIIIRTSHDGAQARLEVEDDGIGMTEDVKARAFERFFSTKTVHEGSGLGLTHAREVVTAHGGTITLEPRTPNGTRAVVCLPLAAAESDPGPRVSLPPPGDEARVLVIDDDPGILRAYRRVLRPHRVETTDGPGAWARFAQGDRDFEMVLCDVTMPVLDGTLLFTRVRERWPGLAERFVFNTGGAISARARQLLEDSGRPILYKPVPRKALLAALASLVGDATCAAE